VTAVVNLIASWTAFFAIVGFFSIATAVLFTACILGSGLCGLARKRLRRKPAVAVAPAPRPSPPYRFDLPRRVAVQRRAEPTASDVEQIITEAKRITRNAANH
jgi:hypothetical protein